jgi:type I restriction enzyme S subunit
MRTEQVPLGSVASSRGLTGGPFGSSLVSNDYELAGVPVIRGTNLGQHKFVGGEFVYVSNEKVERDLARNLAVGDDVVFTQRGTLGQVALVPTDGFQRYVVSQSQMRLRADPAVAFPLYLYYACSSAAFQKQVSDNAISTGVPHINLGILSRLEIPLPPLPEQKAIAEVLSALDDKIAANAKLVEATDQLSQTVFRTLQMESNLLPLSETARFVNGKAFTKGASGTGRVVIRIAELNSGIGGSTVRSDIDVSDDFLARPGDILFAWSGSLTLHRWFRPEGIVNQHIFKVIPNGHPSWLVFELLRERLPYFKGIAADKATTMGHIQRGHLDVMVDVPSGSTIAGSNDLMTALWERALLAERENETLAATRDALLPQLMSGKLRVRDAETAMKGVL